VHTKVRATVQAAKPRPKANRFQNEPRRLLISAEDHEVAAAIRRDFSAAIRKMGMAAKWGVFVAPYAGEFGVFVGRHDGGPIAPDDCAWRARVARRFGC
jgi:hypothetical protein